MEGSMPFREIENDEERIRCQRLTYQQYRMMGYIPANSAGLHVPPCHACASTQILVATADDQILATATLAWEPPLPCESLYAELVNRLRFETREPIAEVTAVAAEPNSPALLTPKLLRWVRDFAHKRTKFVVGCCHPEHEDFWRRFMGATFPEQAIRFACHVGGAPAVWGYMRR